MTMDFLDEVTEAGVTERRFDLKVDQDVVPGIIWAPEGAQTPRPVVLIGHGGTQNKRVENVLALARRLVRHLGYAAVAIDAPGHGDRQTPEERALSREERRARMFDRSPEGVERTRQRSRAAVAEWKATLDSVRALPYVGDGKVGYWGVSMGTALGLPFVAREERVACAVLGLAGLRGDRPGADKFEQHARALTIPVLFLFQWDDEVAPRDSGIALFDAIGSTEKTMHINPGGHLEMPRFERDAVEAFFTRHMGTAEEAR